MLFLFKRADLLLLLKIHYKFQNSARFWKSFILIVLTWHIKHCSISRINLLRNCIFSLLVFWNIILLDSYCNDLIIFILDCTDWKSTRNVKARKESASWKIKASQREWRTEVSRNQREVCYCSCKLLSTFVEKTLKINMIQTQPAGFRVD